MWSVSVGMHPEAGAVPVEEFEEIVGTVDEDEDSTAAGIVAEARDDFGEPRSLNL